MIKKIYDRDTGNIYDVGGSERKVLTYEDVKHCFIVEGPDYSLILDDKDYKNTHIVIDCSKFANSSCDILNVYPLETTKNCVIQLVNFKNNFNYILIRNGKTINFETPMPLMGSDISDFIEYYTSYYTENMEDGANELELKALYSFSSVIIKIDGFGNVSVNLCYEGEM